MSAYAYIGLQGSGKTLKAVNKLYDNFINPKTKDKSEYEYALTNINEFDFNKSDKINKLDFEILYSQLVQLFDMSVNQQCTDTELNEKAKEFNLFNCLIVIDEAPNYLTKDKDEVLLWWIEYHRHMYQDIILITPNKNRFRTEYRNSIHYFVKSVSAKYRIRKNVYRYAVFSNYNMNKDDFEHFESFKVRKELFSLYQSGKSINATPVIYYYLIGIIILLFALVYFSSSFLNTFDPADKKEQLTTNDNKTIKKETVHIKPEIKIDELYSENEKMFIVKCPYTNIEFCYIDENNQIFEFPFKFIQNIVSQTDEKELLIKKDNYFTTFYLITDKNNFNFIKKEEEVKNEKDSSLFNLNN